MYTRVCCSVHGRGCDGVLGGDCSGGNNGVHGDGLDGGGHGGSCFGVCHALSKERLHSMHNNLRKLALIPLNPNKIQKFPIPLPLWMEQHPSTLTRR